MDELLLPSEKETSPPEKRGEFYRSRERCEYRVLAESQPALKRGARAQKEGGKKGGKREELTRKMVEGVRFRAGFDHKRELESAQK